MSVGERLREERVRLGLSQPAFAAIAGATKSGLVKWEKDEASPNANAMIAWADAGADPLYILTGKRTFDIPIDVVPYVQAQLTDIRNEMSDQSYKRLPGEDAEQAEQRCLNWHANALSSILSAGYQLVPEELKDEAAQLLDFATNRSALALYRAGEYTRKRANRRRERQHMARYLKMNDIVVSDEAMELMLSLVIEHGAPTSPLLGLILELLTPPDLNDDMPSFDK